MPKCKSPLFSEIRGAFKNIDVRVHRGVIEISKFRWPSNPRTEAQQKIRKRYGQLVEQWRALSDEEKAEYEAQAKPLKISGWNYFLATNWVMIVGLDLIAEVEATETCTSLEISGLDINTHKFYLLVWTLKNGGGQNMDYYLFINDDENLSNYSFRALIASDKGVSTNYYGKPTFGWAEVGNAESGFGIMILDANGNVRTNTYVQRLMGEDLNVVHRTIVKETTENNITKIKIKAQYTNGIAQGSKIQVYGYKPS